MDNTATLFNSFRTAFIEEHEGTHEGTMMGSPGIQYNKKNFVFYYRNAVCFRLGRDFEPESEGIHDYSLLNPFKNKPPLKDWFIIGSEYQEKWELLAAVALQHIKWVLLKSCPFVESILHTVIEGGRDELQIVPIEHVVCDNGVRLKN